MNNENVALLGFMQRAKDYLKLELQRSGKAEELEKLENIDFDAIKKDLIAKAGAVFDGSDRQTEALLKAGKNAFDEYVSDKKNKATVIDEFARLFDSFNASKEKSVTEDLNEILAQYEPNGDTYIADDDEYLKIISEGSARASMETANAPKFERKKDSGAEELDDVFNEILGNEERQEIKAEVKNTEKPELPDNEEYLKELVKQLKNKIKEENEKKPVVDKKVSVFEKISNLYPYLSGGFIRAVYGMKDGIARENPVGSRIILLHRIYFADVEGLRQFVEIVSNHDYTVNVDEDKLLVDVFREHINSDGKILTNIFEIANQAKVLDGEYEGYRIVNKEGN